MSTVQTLMKRYPAQRYVTVSIHIGLHHGLFQPDN